MKRYQTNNFSNSLTWITRALQFLVGITVLYLVDLQEMQHGLLMGCVLGFLLAFIFIAWPVDEVNLEGHRFYFFKKSVVSFFNQVTVYDIPGLRGVGAFSISHTAGIHGLFIPVMNAYRVEFIFSDNSSESRELLIRKRDLKPILMAVRELINGKA